MVALSYISLKTSAKWALKLSRCHFDWYFFTTCLLSLTLANLKKHARHVQKYCIRLLFKQYIWIRRLWNYNKHNWLNLALSCFFQASCKKCSSEYIWRVYYVSLPLLHVSIIFRIPKLFAHCDDLKNTKSYKLPSYANNLSNVVTR